VDLLLRDHILAGFDCVASKKLAKKLGVDGIGEMDAT